MNKLALPFLIVAATLIAGCTHVAQNNVNIDSTGTQWNQEVSNDSVDDSVTPNSSGDADTDLEEIEAAIDSLNVEEDFPIFDENSI